MEADPVAVPAPTPYLGDQHAVQRGDRQADEDAAGAHPAAEVERQDGDAAAAEQREQAGGARKKQVLLRAHFGRIGGIADGRHPSHGLAQPGRQRSQPCP